jgi:hypothetical protein
VVTIKRQVNCPPVLGSGELPGSAAGRKSHQKLGNRKR